MPVLRLPHDHRRDLRARPPSPRAAGLRSRPRRCRAMIRNVTPSTRPATGALASGCPSIASPSLPSQSCPRRRALLPLHRHPRTPVGPPADGPPAAAAKRSDQDREIPIGRAGPPAGSFPGGFRTPAPAPTPKSRWAGIRNPSQNRTLQLDFFDPGSGYLDRNRKASTKAEKAGERLRRLG